MIDDVITTTLGTLELVREEARLDMKQRIIDWLQHHVCPACEEEYSQAMLVGYHSSTHHAACNATLEDIALIETMPDVW